MVVGTAIRYGLSVRRSNPGAGEIFRTRPEQPWDSPNLLTTGNGSLSWGLIGRGVALTTHPHLPPSLKKEYSYISNARLGLQGLF